MEKQLSASSHIFIHRIFKGIADSSIKIFIPLLIYQQTQNIFLCFYYGAIEYFLTAIFFSAFKNPIKKNPLIYIIIHIIPIISIGFLLLLKLNYFILAIIALFSAISSVFYYGSINLLFGIMDEKTDAAKYETGQHLGKIIFTILSSYVLGKLNNSLIFVVLFSLVVYILSVLPICINYKNIKKELQQLPNAEFKEVFKDNKYFNFYHIFSGVFSIFTEFVLPLYLFINGLSFTVVGILVALQYSLSIVGNYLAKFLDSKEKSKELTIVCSICIFVSLICISFIHINKVIYIFTLVNTICHHMLHTVYFSLFVKDQKEKCFYHYSVFYRDVILNSARTVISLSYIIIPSFSFMFFLGIGSSIGIGVSGYKCDKMYKKV